MILNYIEKGCGRPLILLHGNGNSSRYFKKQVRYFSAKFRVIAVDTRGHGKSPRGGGPFTMERFADDLKIFMEEMGIEKADILGFSDGGFDILQLQSAEFHGSKVYYDALGDFSVSVDVILTAYDIRMFQIPVFQHERRFQ